MSKQSAVVSRNQAFSRFLPGAIETIDGETVKVTMHDLQGAAFDEFARGFLQQQLSLVISQWPHREATYKAFVDDPSTKRFEFVTSMRVIAQTLAIVECRVCGAVTNTITDRSEGKRCRRPACNGGLRILPFVEVHSCGAESNVRIPPCTNGHGNQYMMMERHAQRRWACGMPGCDWSEAAFASFCGKNCYFSILDVPLDSKKKRKSQVLVGSNSVYRTQSVDILNPPQGELGKLFRLYLEYVPALFISEYLGVERLDFSNLEPLFQTLNELKNGSEPEVSQNPAIEALIATFKISEEERNRMRIAMTLASGQSKTAKRLEQFKTSISLVEELVPELGLQTAPWKVLKEVYDLSLAVALPNAANLNLLIERLSGKGGTAAVSALGLSQARADLARCGLEDISLITNFPIVSCAYGYTRGSGYANEEHVLRAFGMRPSVTGGSSDRTPFYTLSTGTEALIVRIAPAAMMTYLKANGFIAESEDPQVDPGRRAWIMRQFMVEDRTTSPAAYAMFSAVHSYAHRMIEQLALESCFSTTSLSEMILPAALSFIIYVNQRSEFNIGGLSSFVEQRLGRALKAVTEPTPCMFDPICTMKDGGACNGCLYLPEVTCREFNAGLTRNTLHGGEILSQHELAPIVGARHFTGFFEALARH